MTAAATLPRPATEVREKPAERRPRTCQAMVVGPLGRQTCSEPAVVDASGICLNEHIDRSDLCVPHAMMLWRGLGICTPCWDASRAIEQLEPLEIRPLLGGAR